jgi:hypothetical protein
MSDTYPPLKSTLSSGIESVFPTLKPAQIERMAAIGRVRQVEPGEVLVEAGQKDAQFLWLKRDMWRLCNRPALLKNP